MSHLPALPLLVNIRLTWLCFQLQRREPLVCKLQLLHLYISWQPPLTFDQIYPHCPPKRFQKCHHGSRCNTPKHMQKCKDIFLFCIQKQIVSLINPLFLGTSYILQHTDHRWAAFARVRLEKRNIADGKTKKIAGKTARCARVAN